jgi:quinol monooxygenase YgiN
MSDSAPGKVVVSRFRSRPGCRDAVIEIFGWHCAATHDEPGVLVFALHQEQDDPDAFVAVEAYRSAEDLAIHKETPHYRRALSLLPDLITGRPESTICTPRPLGDPKKGTVD